MLTAIVPGGVFAAMRYQRDDASSAIQQQVQIADSAIEVVKAIRDELEHTRAAQRECQVELTRVRAEIFKLRLILAARGTTGDEIADGID